MTQILKLLDSVILLFYYTQDHADLFSIYAEVAWQKCKQGFFLYQSQDIASP